MSFRALLIAILVALLIGSTAVITRVLFKATDSAVHELATGQINASLDSVSGQIQNLFDPCERILVSLTDNFRSKNVPIDDTKELARELATLLAFEKGITWINFGFADGSFAGAECRSGGISVHIANPANASALSWDFNPNGSLENERRNAKFEDFNATARPWFQAALSKNSPVWTKPYDFAGGGRGVSCSIAYRDQEQKLIGVLAIDFSLEEITKYLHAMNRDLKCKALVFLKDGQLLAPVEARHTEALVPEVQSLLSDAQTENDLFKLGRRVVSEFSSGGKNLIVGLRCTKIAGGVECLGAVVFNRQETFGSIEQSLRQSWALAASALIVSLIVATFLAKRVSTPLQILTQEVARIGRFEMDSVRLPDSLIQEIRVLSESIGRMRDSLKSFSKYVPVHIVRDLVQAGGEASLGGGKRVITVLFCDIEGFTGYSEKVSCEKAVETLTGYLEILGEAIHRNDGVIDKFLGDGLMALFNAPAPLAPHARSACLSAVEAQQRLLEKAKQGWTLKVRIGLHTNEALVGNVGTPERFSYTAIGDGVNLCSRLEGLNKIYGTRIIASSDTAKAAGDEEFVWRKLDRVAVVGRVEPLEIHELVGLRTEVSEELVSLAGTYTRALEQYFQRNFAAAKALLAGIAEKDAASHVLLKRIREMEALPESEPWDGVFKATSK